MSELNEQAIETIRCLRSMADELEAEIVRGGYSDATRLWDYKDVNWVSAFLDKFAVKDLAKALSLNAQEVVDEISAKQIPLDRLHILKRALYRLLNWAEVEKSGEDEKPIHVQFAEFLQYLQDECYDAECTGEAIGANWLRVLCDRRMDSLKEGDSFSF